MTKEELINILDFEVIETFRYWTRYRYKNYIISFGEINIHIKDVKDVKLKSKSISIDILTKILESDIREKKINNLMKQ